MSALPAPHLGPLFGIVVEGDGKLPQAAPNPATPEEHEAWLSKLRENGFKVEVQTINERAA